MTDRSANSYDLKQAQQILNTLFPSADGTTQEEQDPDEAPQYLRLSEESPARMASRTAMSPVGSPPEVFAATNEALNQNFPAGKSALPGA